MDNFAGQWCNNTPTATITSPANGASFNSGTAITFSGYGMDGDGAGDVTAWAWAIDGNTWNYNQPQVSQSASFTKSDLAPGVHTAQFWLADSWAASPIVQVSFTVNAAYSCTNTPPANATLCPGDDTGLTANVARTLVTTCGAPKCEYTCTAPYINSGGACVLPACNGGSCSGVPNTSTCSGDGTTLYNSSWHGVTACTSGAAAADECQCQCTGGFAWNVAQSKCVCSAVAPYEWRAIDPLACAPGDNCTKKYGFYECYNNCGQPAGASDCESSVGPAPTPNPERTCPCTNRDNTYREVNP